MKYTLSCKSLLISRLALGNVVLELHAFKIWVSAPAVPLSPQITALHTVGGVPWGLGGM